MNNKRQFEVNIIKYFNYRKTSVRNQGKANIMEWTYGYFTDVSYTYGYYREISLPMLRLACLCGGVQPQLGRRVRYLELGFGQGLSVAIHAAATEGEFWGTDFNPEQAVHALELAAALDGTIRLFDNSFDEFFHRSDLPEFDVIVLHGVWSWISDSNRQFIIGIIRKKLRVGGIIYISYNCLPGWAPAVPVRQLLSLYTEYGGGHISGARGTIESALQFAENVVNSGSVYFKQNPTAAHHIEQIVKQDRHYIAHEYLNADWHMAHFSDVARAMGEAKLDFVGSARLLDRIDGIHLTKDGQKFLGGIGNLILRETVRDYLVNQRFRCDVFVKGRRPLSPVEQREAWLSQSFILTIDRESIPKKLKYSLGEVNLKAEIYDPIIAALAADSYRPKMIRELMDLTDAININDMVEALTALVGAGFASPSQTPSDEIVTRCDALNRNIGKLALLNRNMEFLASPITGGGIFVSRISQLFIAARREGNANPDELAKRVWDKLDGMGEKIIKDGKIIESKEDNITFLHALATEFTDRKIEIFNALGII